MASLAAVPMQGNFLVPNATFLVELAAFAIMLFILGRYVVPPINRAMTARQNAIREHFNDLEQAKADAREAEEKFRSQITEARHEAARIREEAREQGASIIAEMREQAREESDRIVRHAHAQIDAERQQAVQQLRAEIGSMATELASRIVGESLEDEARRSRVVERFLEALESGQSEREPVSGGAR
jgi:F-type H+-transporting ATPase subunit b